MGSGPPSPPSSPRTIPSRSGWSACRRASAAPSGVITDVVARLHPSLQAPVYTRTESISTETISVRALGPFEVKPMGGYPTVTERQTIYESLVGTQLRSGLG